MTGQPTPSPDYSILSAFQAVKARPRASILYQVSLLLVAITMLILPLIYLAFVGAIAYVVFYHATHNWSVQMKVALGGGPLAMGLMFLCYLIPILAGVVMVFVMLKPLFAGQPRGAQPLALNPSDNPLLYAFIEKICDTVGAPSPKRIDLDCHLNASVGFRNGRASMVSDDLVLTIGLPLVANLTTAEFAGVVAHEFGHFNQRIGLRLGYMIRSINRWFSRVVYQRDAWDKALKQWAEETDKYWVAVIFWIVQIVVFCERMILSTLMYTGLLIGGFMMRQLEYDADACEIKLVGSDTFERTFRKLATLDAAAQHMRRQMRNEWRHSRQLPDNMCELLRRARESLPATVIEKIQASYGMRSTGLFDSHPSPADRIRRARQAQDPGAFHDDRPAAELFTSFEHPARFVTLLHYTDELGIPVTPEMLLRVETKATTAQPDCQSSAVAQPGIQNDYFLGILTLIQPLPISSPLPSADYEADFTALTQLATGLQQAAEQLGDIGEQYRQATGRLVQARAALRLLEARAPIKAGDFGLEAATLNTAQQGEAEATVTRESLRHSVREVSAAFQRRLQLGVGLKLADGGELQGDANAAERVAQAVSQLQTASVDYASRRELTEAFAVLDRLCSLRDAEGESPALARALAAQVNAVNSFRTQPAYLPAQTAALPKAHLILSRKPKEADAAELKTLRQQTRQWLADYQANLDLVVEFALAGEHPGA